MSGTEGAGGELRILFVDDDPRVTCRPVPE